MWPEKLIRIKLSLLLNYIAIGVVFRIITLIFKDLSTFLLEKFFCNV